MLRHKNQVSFDPGTTTKYFFDPQTQTKSIPIQTLKSSQVQPPTLKSSKFRPPTRKPSEIQSAQQIRFPLYIQVNFDASTQKTKLSSIQTLKQSHFRPRHNN